MVGKLLILDIIVNGFSHVIHFSADILNKKNTNNTNKYVFERFIACNYNHEFMTRTLSRDLTLFFSYKIVLRID